MSLEHMEDAQDNAAVAYLSYREIYEKRKASMLDAYDDLKRLENIDAETAFFSFGQFDADMAIRKAADAETVEATKEAFRLLAAPFVWTAFRMLDELRQEGKIKE